jgi:hypothetical protein
MEDRTSAGLWLELVGSTDDPYDERAAVIAKRPAVSTAWWGTNCNPDRTDLPRVLPEFVTLGVYEVETGFIPPEVPDGTTGVHFLRTLRPGQGVLTGAPTTGIVLVLISPRDPEGADALRDWADFVHIRHIAEVAVPGYTMITPYVNAEHSDPLFLHLYEIDGDDPESIFKSMTPLVSQRLGEPGTAAFDQWAWHKQLRIFYVNSFKRLGSFQSKKD